MQVWLSARRKPVAALVLKSHWVCQLLEKVMSSTHTSETHVHSKSFPVNSPACWKHHDPECWGQGRNREAHNLPPPPRRLIYDKRSQAIFLHITSVGNIISVWPLGMRACFAPNTASAHLVCLAGSGETHSICAPKTLRSQLHYVSFNFPSSFFLFFFSLDLWLHMLFLAC